MHGGRREGRTYCRQVRTEDEAQLSLCTSKKCRVVTSCDSGDASRGASQWAESEGKGPKVTLADAYRLLDPPSCRRTASGRVGATELHLRKEFSKKAGRTMKTNRLIEINISLLNSLTRTSINILKMGGVVVGSCEVMHS